MVSRLLAHSILALSIILAAYGIFQAFGSVVQTPSEKVPSWQMVSSNFTYRVWVVIHTFSFEKTFTPRDTITLSIRNSGNIPFVLRRIYINGLIHEPLWYDSYMFDEASRFSVGMAVPSGGYGLVRLRALPSDNEPADHIYEVIIVSNIGQLREKFPAENAVYRDRASWQPLLGLAVESLSIAAASIYFYRKFSDAEGQNLFLR